MNVAGMHLCITEQVEIESAVPLISVQTMENLPFIFLLLLFFLLEFRLSLPLAEPIPPAQGQSRRADTGAESLAEGTLTALVH